MPLRNFSRKGWQHPHPLSLYFMCFINKGIHDVILYLAVTLYWAVTEPIGIFWVPSISHSSIWQFANVLDRFPTSRDQFIELSCWLVSFHSEENTRPTLSTYFINATYVIKWCSNPPLVFVVQLVTVIYNHLLTWYNMKPSFGNSWKSGSWPDLSFVTSTLSPDFDGLLHVSNTIKWVPGTPWICLATKS